MFSKQHSKPFIFILPVMLSAVILAGCNLPNGTPVTPTTIPSALSSPTSPLPLNTATSPAPSPTSIPSVTSTPLVDQLIFATGATAGVATGNLQAGQTRNFTVNAEQNQAMILILNSPNNDLILGVMNPDGSTLLDPTKKWNQFQWLLPTTGVYTIQVLGAAGPESYNLTVKIAAPVNFASGSDSTTLSGKTVNGFVVSYAAYCKSGQTMTTSLNVPSSSAYLDVFGLASGPLLSSTLKVSVWSGVLPATEDYVIEVIPANGVEVSYQLTVKCH